MKKGSGKITITLQYWAMLCAYAAFGFTPLWLATRIAGLLGNLFRVVDRKHAGRVEDAVKAALGVDDREAARLTRENYRHYAYTVMEIFRLARMPPEAAMARIRVGDEIERAKAAQAEGRGLMLLTGHLGNWEWCGFGVGMHKLAEGVVARPLDNPKMDLFLRRTRERAGFEVWSKFGAIRRVFRTLARGGGVGALVDQDGGPRGLQTCFLGRPCTTMSMPVEAAIKTGSPMVVGAVFRDGAPMRFVARLKEVRRPDPDAELDAELLRLTQAVNDDLGDLIREFPEQWIWTHQRWRHGKGDA